MHREEPLVEHATSVLAAVLSEVVLDAFVMYEGM
jgi:hypothetical protein